jgi:hypothetical protein
MEGTGAGRVVAPFPQTGVGGLVPVREKRRREDENKPILTKKHITAWYKKNSV